MTDGDKLWDEEIPDSGSDGRGGVLKAWSAGVLDEKVTVYGRLYGISLLGMLDYTDGYEFVVVTPTVIVKSEGFTIPSGDIRSRYCFDFYDADEELVNRTSLAYARLTDTTPITVTGLKVNHRYRLYIFSPNAWSGARYDYEISLTPVADAVRKVTVEFDACQGVASLPKAEYEVGKSYGTFPSASREGYSFEGWYTSANGGTRVWATDPVSESVSKLYAHWGKVPVVITTYTISYRPGNHASGVNSKQFKSAGEQVTLQGAAYVRTGYAQTGWSTDANGSMKSYDLYGAYAEDRDITLYPYWERDEGKPRIPTTADISVATPPGWSSPVVVGKSEFDTSDGRDLTAFDELYCRVGIRSSGAVGGFSVRVSDGLYYSSVQRVDAMSAGETRVILFKIGKFKAGVWSLRIELDCYDSVSEGDEANNLVEKAFVTAAGSCYCIHFNLGGGSGTIGDMMCPYGQVCALPQAKGRISKPGWSFVGWQWKLNNKSRLYDDGMLVFNLAEPGETVTMTAIWE